MVNFKKAISCSYEELRTFIQNEVDANIRIDFVQGELHFTDDNTKKNNETILQDIQKTLCNKYNSTHCCIIDDEFIKDDNKYQYQQDELSDILILLW